MKGEKIQGKIVSFSSSLCFLRRSDIRIAYRQKFNIIDICKKSFVIFSKSKKYTTLTLTSPHKTLTDLLQENSFLFF
jgi:hypothetical protein